jgi:outer membrane immunogenic protein
MEAKWDAGLRGRVGFLINPTMLVFATGGVSWLSVESTASCGTSFPVGWCVAAGRLGTSDTASKTLTGWTIGGGVEAMVWNYWLARVEYRYADYDSYGANLLTGGTVANIDAIAADFKYQTHTILFGLAYKFGDYGKQPVVARY